MTSADPLAMEGDALLAALRASVERETGRPYVPPKPCWAWTVAEWEAACPVVARPFGEPRPGLFRLRAAAKTGWLPARIWSYRPRVAGTDHLAAHVGGIYADVEYVWTHGREIDREHYDRLMAEPPPNPMQPVVHRRQPKEAQL